MIERDGSGIKLPTITCTTSDGKKKILEWQIDNHRNTATLVHPPVDKYDMAVLKTWLELCTTKRVLQSDPIRPSGLKPIRVKRQYISGKIINRNTLVLQSTHTFSVKEINKESQVNKEISNSTPDIVCVQKLTFANLLSDSTTWGATGVHLEQMLVNHNNKITKLELDLISSDVHEELKNNKLLIPVLKKKQEIAIALQQLMDKFIVPACTDFVEFEISAMALFFREQIYTVFDTSYAKTELQNLQQKEIQRLLKYNFSAKKEIREALKFQDKETLLKLKNDLPGLIVANLYLKPCAESLEENPNLRLINMIRQNLKDMKLWSDYMKLVDHIFWRVQEIFSIYKTLNLNPQKDIGYKSLSNFIKDVRPKVSPDSVINKIAKIKNKLKNENLPQCKLGDPYNAGDDLYIKIDSKLYKSLSMLNEELESTKGKNLKDKFFTCITTELRKNETTSVTTPSL